MNGEHGERPATCTAADVRAAELAGYARGFADGRCGRDAEAAAQAEAFAELVHRTFAGAVPHAELQARRDGPDSTNARRARDVAEELAALVAADVAAERHALATTPTIPRRTAA